MGLKILRKPSSRDLTQALAIVLNLIAIATTCVGIVVTLRHG